MIRKAKIADAQKIHHLVSGYAQNGVMLGRSLNSIYESIRDFWVAVDDETNDFIGCVALHVVGWEGLAEVRSLSVNQDLKKKGFGRLLLDACMDEAADLGIEKVFALTFVPDFFYKNHFELIDKDQLPHKIWSDCIDCPFFPDCTEIAVIKKVE